MHFKHVKSSFGFLYLKCVEKNGNEIRKPIFLQPALCKGTAFSVNGPSLIKFFMYNGV